MSVTPFYEVKLEQFAGPFDALLELIEEKKLDISLLSLSEITADFLEYVKTAADIEPRMLADFLVVAAKLILIKSKLLIPELKLTVEEEEEIGNLEARLRLYREYRRASRSISDLLGRRAFLFKKDYLRGLPVGFYPASNITVERLTSCVATVFAVLQEFVLEQKSIRIEGMRIEDKIHQIIEHLKQRITAVFGDMLKHSTKAEIIVSFLAVLQLLKERMLEAEQKTLFGDIEIKKMQSR
ncbi:MAG: hypothetical protein A2939_01535 [Parcubacteria group bacterium RIFCSPLOWO2_01_FULL_48_18]|nr:MAG: hypothetical protein A2939_01535 [Parcubacteria group bacterium RIFCSPLOWO2_01_FULL_48_18]